MPRLVQKSGYIRAGNAGGYMKYIATREGVEKLYGTGSPTQKQMQLIQKLLKDFPDSKELFEYADYTSAPTVASASAFITMALDANIHTMQPGDGYMKYIAQRPGAEKHGAHGLFGQQHSVDLDTALNELKSHQGNVWTLIYSLRREDAARLGYDSAAGWRSLLLAHQTQLAEAMKIPPNQLRWYAAFHDAGHHPHIHMMAWADDPKWGYLSKQGIAAMRSTLTNAIFKDELKELYVKKDVSYKELTAAAREAMGHLINQMGHAVCDSPAIAEKLTELAHQLETVKGKKVYGYLKKPVKETVDSIVDELAALSSVAECYAAWNRLRDDLEHYYHSEPREHLPLSGQKEFKAIKNLVIREAERLRLGEFTFEDEQMNDAPEDDEAEDGVLEDDGIARDESEDAEAGNSTFEDNRGANDASEDDVRSIASDAARPTGKPQAFDSSRNDSMAMAAAHQSSTSFSASPSVSAPPYVQAKIYRGAKATLYDKTASMEEKAEAVKTLESLWSAGYSIAAHQLGKVWRDGLCEVVDEQWAEEWFHRSADAGNDCSAYALGKLYQAQERIDEAVAWYLKAAEKDNSYAQYRLGKLYLAGEKMLKDVPTALSYLNASAGQSNQFAQYTLGKVYLMGEDVPKDIDKSLEYLKASAGQGNQFAEYTLGKLYLQGEEVGQDLETAKDYLTRSAAQGNEYAQFFLDHFDWYTGKSPSAFLAATRLLRSVAGVFRDNSVPPTNPAGMRIDSKRRKKLLAKRLAMGHKIDDHEDSAFQSQKQQ